MREGEKKRGGTEGEERERKGEGKRRRKKICDGYIAGLICCWIDHRTLA